MVIFLFQHWEKGSKRVWKILACPKGYILLLLYKLDPDMSTSDLKRKWYGTTFIHVPGLHLSKQGLKHPFFYKQKKRSQGKTFFGTIFSPLCCKVLFVQIRLVWWKDLTECVLVLCKPGFCVVECVGSCRFWIWERSLDLCWNSCVNNNSNCCSSWHGYNSYSCSCDS